MVIDTRGSGIWTDFWVELGNWGEGCGVICFGFGEGRLGKIRGREVLNAGQLSSQRKSREEEERLGELWPRS